MTLRQKYTVTVRAVRICCIKYLLNFHIMKLSFTVWPYLRFIYVLPAFFLSLSCFLFVHQRCYYRCGLLLISLIDIPPVINHFPVLNVPPHLHVVLRQCIYEVYRIFYHIHSFIFPKEAFLKQLFRLCKYLLKLLIRQYLPAHIHLKLIYTPTLYDLKLIQYLPSVRAHKLTNIFIVITASGCNSQYYNHSCCSNAYYHCNYIFLLPISPTLFFLHRLTPLYLQF